MSLLAASIQAVIDGFVDQLLHTVRNASLDDLLGVESSPRKRRRVVAPSADGPSTMRGGSGKKKPSRLPRRSAEQIEATARAVANLLRKHAGGLRSEQIRVELGLDVREVPRVLRLGLEDKMIRVLGGEKRSTTYGAASKPVKTKTKAKPKPVPKAKTRIKAEAKKMPVKAKSKKNSVHASAAAA